MLLKFLVLFLCFYNKALCDFNLSVVHFNDFHARYEPVNNSSGRCTATNSVNCIGGFSRLYAKSRKLLQERGEENSLFLNAGDNFSGSLWYNIYKWNVTQHFLNKFHLDALTLGNHEFDDKIDGLLPYLENIKSPIVVSNLDVSKEPRLEGLFNKSVIIEKGGRNFGIIGVLTSSTKYLSRPEHVNFLDESNSINLEAENLAKNRNIFTNIVLSHCGYEADLELARKSKNKISLIVGGHTDTFLYTGEHSPGPDIPAGPYPTVVINNDQEKVLIVQASAYTKYLGDLLVTYDDSGKVKDFQGSPIFLDSSLPTDSAIDEELNEWKKLVDATGKEIVGDSIFPLYHKPCRVGECLLGNFATDAMVYWHLNKSKEVGWISVSMALIHAGGLRASLSSGVITYNDLATTFPFEDSIYILEMKGKHIYEIFEQSVDDSHLTRPHFYQVSGMHLIFNTSKPSGSRIQSFKIRCQNCDIPHYENIDRETVYKFALNGFLINSMFQPLFQKYAISRTEGSRDLDVYEKYLRAHNPLYREIEERIQIVN